MKIYKILEKFWKNSEKDCTNIWKNIDEILKQIWFN